MKKLKLWIAFFLASTLGSLESILFRKSTKPSKKSELTIQGFSFADDALIEILDLEIESHKEITPYYTKNIISRSSINSLAHTLVSNVEIRNKLSGFFDGAFCIGFISFYKTSTLPQALEGKSVYANHWHLDTKLTRNSVKILLLPNKISNRQGPLQIFSKEDSSLLKEHGFTRGGILPENLANKVKPVTFFGETSRVLFARTHVCMHAAGVPDPGHSREQIMIQLNPARSWSYHTDLYEKQFAKEPTLPFIKNIARSKIKVPNSQ